MSPAFSANDLALQVLGNNFSQITSHRSLVPINHIRRKMFQSPTFGETAFDVSESLRLWASKCRHLGQRYVFLLINS